MEDISLHILDIAENAVSAGAGRIDIRIAEDEEKDLLTIEVADDGRGMDSKRLKRATDPFYTTKKGSRIGLGLPLLSQAAEDADGKIEVKSQVNRGTFVRATFRKSHIDCRPLGDISQTLTTLVAGHPDVRFTFQYRKGEKEYSLDSAEMRAQRLPEGQ